MSNAPYLLAKHRAGARIGHDRIADSLYLDGLEDAYEPGKLMGAFAEETAREYGRSPAPSRTPIAAGEPDAGKGGARRAALSSTRSSPVEVTAKSRHR